VTPVVTPLVPPASSSRKDTVVNVSAPAALAARVTRSGFAVSPAGRWTSVAGAVYVAAWITGLLLLPSAPSATGPAAVLSDFYATHGPVIVVQALLVHGEGEIGRAHV